MLGAVQVKTPDRALDIMLNRWLLYQTLACRVWARAGFYQASGAYGFRDQLQDVMALVRLAPGHRARASAARRRRQFLEGDVQHWWLPETGQGVRTRISDDRVWLAYVVGALRRGDRRHGVLDETVPFLEGPVAASRTSTMRSSSRRSPNRRRACTNIARGRSTPALQSARTACR